MSPYVYIHMSKQLVVVPAQRRRRRQAPRKYPVRFRALPTLTGRGAYRKKYPRSTRSSTSYPYGATIGTGIGTALGGPIGGMIGGGVGHLAQSLIKHISGFGDYTVEVNSLMGDKFNPPELINQSHRSVCLRHREFIGDVTATSAFTVQAYDINPGLASTFPWLAGVANNFEEYMISGMVFEYKSLSADYTTAASAALGYVAMATQYNPLLPDFPDKIHLENYEFANSAKPSENFIHPIECKRSLNPVNQLYVRTGPVEDNADQRLYDLGKFQIATAGNSGSGILGELWCTYEVHLFKPKLIDNDDDVLSGHWSVGTIVGGSILGATQVPDATNTLDIVFTPTTMTFPATLRAAKFLITWNCVGANTPVTPGVVTATSGCTIISDFANHTIGQFSTPQAGASSTSMVFQVVVEITDYSAVLSVTGGVINATPSSCDIHIAQMYLA